MVLVTSQVLGLLGIALGLLGYLPQVFHLIRQQCAAGVSVQAYLVWLTGLDLFATKYRGQTCPLHRLPYQATGLTTASG